MQSLVNSQPVQRILIIQTAFIGDVVLATALIEKLKGAYPEANIDFLLRKGNENLLSGNPHVHHVYVWDKKSDKLPNLWKLARTIRKCRYDLVVNAHRGATTGFVTWFSRAKERRGFVQNPFSWSFTRKSEHRFSKPEDAHFLHEVERNQELISDLSDLLPAKPRLYPAPADFEKVLPLQTATYVCIAPSSVWATKRFPTERWKELINAIPDNFQIFLLGGPEDRETAEALMNGARPGVRNLCGQLSILQSSALMQRAAMNYTNDSGPMHFASAMNAPVTAVYCSTHPCFGFGPLSDVRKVVEVSELYCKPCGLHGYPSCPQGHFKCAWNIRLNDLLWWTTQKM